MERPINRHVRVGFTAAGGAPALTGLVGRRNKQMMKISIFDCLPYTVAPNPCPDERCQQFYEEFEVGELVQVNHKQLVDEICVVVAVADGVGPGIVPVWCPRFPCIHYLTPKSGEVVRVAAPKGRSALPKTERRARRRAKRVRALSFR